jgi:hypothetical protein
MEYFTFRRCPIPVAGRLPFNARRRGASGIIATALLALALCLSSSIDVRAQTTCITGGNAASASGSSAFACGPDARANANLATAIGDAAQAAGTSTTAASPGLAAGETFGMTAYAGFFDHNAVPAFPASGAAGRNFAGRGERWAVQFAGRAGVQVSW